MPSRSPTDRMWAQACELIDQAERMHRQFFRLTASARPHAMWEPPVDVFEDEREVVDRRRAARRRRRSAIEVTHRSAAPGRARRVSAALRRLAPRRAPAGDPVRLLRAPHPAARRGLEDRHA